MCWNPASCRKKDMDSLILHPPWGTQLPRWSSTGNMLPPLCQDLHCPCARTAGTVRNSCAHDTSGRKWGGWGMKGSVRVSDYWNLRIFWIGTDTRSNSTGMVHPGMDPTTLTLLALCSNLHSLSSLGQAPQIDKTKNRICYPLPLTEHSDLRDWWHWWQVPAQCMSPLGLPHLPRCPGIGGGTKHNKGGASPSTGMMLSSSWPAPCAEVAFQNKDESLSQEIPFWREQKTQYAAQTHFLWKTIASAALVKDMKRKLPTLIQPYYSFLRGSNKVATRG